MDPTSDTSEVPYAIVSGGFQPLPFATRLPWSAVGLQENDLSLTASQIPRAGRTDALGTTNLMLYLIPISLASNVYYCTKHNHSLSTSRV